MKHYKAPKRVFTEKDLNFKMLFFLNTLIVNLSMVVISQIYWPNVEIWQKLTIISTIHTATHAISSC